jgi:hypothetical protein
MMMKSTLSLLAALMLMPLAGLHAAGQLGRPAGVMVAQILENPFPGRNQIKNME